MWIVACGWWIEGSWDTGLGPRDRGTEGKGVCPDFVSLTAFPDSISLASLGGAGGGMFEIVDCGLRRVGPLA